MFSLLESERLTNRQREVPIAMPPMYQEEVSPSPISIYEAVLRVFSLSDFPGPRMPLILSSLATLMLI